MRIELYGNTGFNHEDRPEDLFILEDADLIASFSNYNIIQTEDLAEVTVDDLSEEDARNVDYVIIEDGDDARTGYIKSSYKFEADGTCTFYLVEDEFATVGGFKPLSGNELLYCTASRCHVNDDDETYYTELEPFKPSERCHCIEGIHGVPMDHTMSDQVYNFLETVVMPPRLVKSVVEKKIVDQVAETVVPTIKESMEHPGGAWPFLIGKLTNCVCNFLGISTGETVEVTGDASTNQMTSVTTKELITPAFSPLTQTQFTLKKLFDKGQTVLKTGSRWWNGDNMTGSISKPDGGTESMDVMRALRASGSENAAVAYWSVPINYVETMSDAGYSTEGGSGGISAITNKIYNNTVLFTTTFNEYKNNKVYYGQALTFKVFSPVSGESIEKQPYEIRNPELKPSDHESQADYSITADLRSDGCPIFAWKYINGEDQTDSYVETIRGGNWRQIPLAASGYGFDTYNQLMKSSDESAKFRDWLSVIGSVGTLVTGLYSGNPYMTTQGTAQITQGFVNGFDNFYQSRQELKRKLEQEGAAASVPLKVSSNNYLREIGRNSFYNLFQLYSENDIKAFDRFLTLYGYKVNNKILTEEDFYSRPSFNFIKINEMGVKSEKHSIKRINRMIADLKTGLRIWHEIPNKEAIDTGNKESE